MATWKDGTTTARSAAQLEASVIGETFINVDHPTYAGDIQAAIDAHTAGTFYIPAKGTARVQTATLTYKANQSFLGDGRQASILDWATDLGAGVWAMEPNVPTTDGTYMQSTFRGLGFRGESYGETLVMNTQATQNDGLRVGRRSYLVDCAIGGFGIGFGINADHTYARYSEISGNHYNAAWLSNPAAYGDVYWDEVLLDGASRAGILVQDGNILSDSRLLRCSLGRCPYGILRETGATSSFILNSQLVFTGVESVGNGFIAGLNDTDNINNTYIAANNSVEGTFKITAVPYDAMIQCGSMAACYIDSYLCFPASTIPDIAWVYTTNGAVGNTHFARMNASTLDAVHTNARPFLARPSSAGPVQTSFSTASNQRGVFVKANATTAKGDLMRLTTGDIGQPYTTAGQIPLGIARHDAASGTTVAVLTSGQTGALAHVDGSGLSGTVWLKPSATAGRVAEASSYSDGPIIGASTGSVAANGFSDMHLRLGIWDSQ